MRRIQSLRITALAAALSAIYPLQAFANAGVAQFAVGDVAVQRASGSSTLASGARLESGDTVTTGASGRTQLRFTDGGMVSLQPNSQFKLTRYTDSAAGGGQDSFLVDLARGGMRALTGLIGKRNRDSYKVTTTTATIGIRGSGFSMAYNPDGTLGVTTELDAIEVCTQAGCVGLNVGESVVVTDASSLPRRTFIRASWNTPNPNRKISARNDDVDATGKALNLQVDTGLAFTIAGLTEGEATDNRLYLNGALVSDEGSGKVLGYLSRDNVRGSGGTIEVDPSNTQGSLAGGDLMILGTWTSPVWSDSSLAINKAGFVAGVPTPESALRTVGDVRGRYDLYRATPVFSQSGVTGELLNSSHFLVDFRSAFAAIDANLDVLMPTRILSIEVPGGVTEPTEPPGTYYQLRGSATAANGGFSGKLAVYGQSNGFYAQLEEYSMQQYLMGEGQFNGFFGGPQAGNLGVSFSGSTGPQHGNIAGAGIFYRSESAPNPTTTITQQTLGYNYYNFQMHAIDGAGVIVPTAATEYSYEAAAVSNGGSVYYDFPSSPSVFGFAGSCCGPATSQAVFSGSQLRSWDSGQSHGGSGTEKKLAAVPAPNVNTIQSYGAYGQPGASDYLGWGSWKQASVQRSDINSGSATALTDVHYLVGQKSNAYFGSSSLSATYNLIGGSNPTATLGGVTQTGSILPTSNLVINFADSSVAASIGVKFANGTDTLLGTGVAQSGDIRWTTGSMNFSGFLSGNQGERAGIVYGVNGHSTFGNIRGAAAFQTKTPPGYYD